MKQLKAFAKSKPTFDKNYGPYKAAYGSTPVHAASNQAIQQKTVIHSMRMVSPVALMIQLFQWNGKEINRIWKVSFPPWNSSARRWSRNTTVKPKPNAVSATVKIPAPLLLAEEWIYIYPEKNLRAYPGVERGSAEWDVTYKIRVNVEKSINQFKDSFCIAAVKPKIRKHYMQIFCLLESLNWLRSWLPTKSISINTCEASNHSLHRTYQLHNLMTLICCARKQTIFTFHLKNPA